MGREVLDVLKEMSNCIRFIDKGEKENKEASNNGHNPNCDKFQILARTTAGHLAIRDSPIQHDR
eukprot:scaffold543_cov119-Cylindrotheca_fusiformis.AAC.23